MSQTRLRLDTFVKDDLYYRQDLVNVTDQNTERINMPSVMLRGLNT